MSADDDHQHLLDSVKSAMETHAETEVDAPAQEAVEDQSATDDMALRVAAQLNEQQRSEHDGRKRDDRGRFAKVSDTENPAPVETPDWQQHRKQDLPEYASSWNEQAKLDYRNSPAIQAAIELRDHQVKEGFEQYRQRLEPYQQVEAALAPQWDAYASHGFQSPGNVFQHLLEVNDRLMADPQAALQLAQSLSPQHQAAFRQHYGGQFSDKDVQAIREHIAQEIQKGIEAGLKQERQAQARVQQKVKAANASLNGAPHGTATSPRPNGKAAGSFADYAEDVRTALNSLS